LSNRLLYFIIHFKGVLLPIDLAVLRFFNITIANPFFVYFFAILCDFSIWRWPLILIVILLLWKGGPKGRWAVGMAVVTALVIDPSIYNLLKPLFGRLRPCHNPELDWVRTVTGCGGRYSFPSSHAANFFGISLAIVFFYKSARYYLFTIAALVAIGRVYLGVHYPSDVLAGAVYGIIIAICLRLLAVRIFGDRLGKFLGSKSDG